MLSRYARITAAVLSGVTASLLVTAATAQAATQGKPVVVYAEPSADLRTERVNFSDLNLTLASHQKALNSRVGGAVRNVCEIEDATRMALDPDYRQCASESWDAARPQIARAIAKAEQLAQNGQSPIAAGAITLSVRAR